MDPSPNRSLWSRLTQMFQPTDTIEDLEQAITQAHKDGELEATEGSMLLSILKLDDIQVQDIMTPRIDCDFVSTKTTLSDVAKLIVESGHSRIPVYEDNRDNIVGIAFAKDMLHYILDAKGQDLTVESIMRTPFFVPETKPAIEILQEFRSRKNHLAIVVDEYGGTAGIVTIEDLLEEIVGDIEDEHDAPKEEDIIVLDDNTLQLSGRAYLEDLEPFDMKLDAEDVDTIGGYLCLMSGHVPVSGERFSFEGWTFIVDDADLKQILKVTATKEEVKE